MLDLLLNQYVRVASKRRFLPCPDRCHILIACFPKSGSTFTARVLADQTGFRETMFHRGGWYNEQNVCVDAVRRSLARDTVTQQHLPGTPDNVRVLARYGIRPVVLVRNLFDVCASLYDHCHRDSLACSECYLTEEFFDLDDDTKLDMVVDLFMPWYMKFYASWFDAERRGEISFAWARYEQLVEDGAGFFRRLLAHYDIERSPESIEAGIERCRGAGTRLNKGVAGRGEERLSDAQKDRIRRMAGYYPWVDFSRVGLGGAVSR